MGVTVSKFWESGPLKIIELESGGWEVAEDWSVHIPYLQGWPCRLDDGSGMINFAGVATLRKGFRCDGGSAVAVDTDSKVWGFARPGFGIHDLGYRLGRAGDVAPSWRIKFDQAMYDLHIQHGVPWLRAQWLYRGVRLFSGKHFKRQRSKEKIVRIVS